MRRKASSIADRGTAARLFGRGQAVELDEIASFFKNILPTKQIGYVTQTVVVQVHVHVHVVGGCFHFIISIVNDSTLKVFDRF